MLTRGDNFINLDTPWYTNANGRTIYGQCESECDKKNFPPVEDLKYIELLILS